jgi:septum formation protein
MDARTPFPEDFQLFLGSQSPRRHSLLRELGVPFTIVSSGAQEALEGGPADRLAEANAMAKVKHARVPDDALPGAFVLGTDTLVTLNGLVLGKPASRDEAREMLSLLSGRRHEVVSGVALVRSGLPGANEEAAWRAEAATRVTSAVTQVTFERLSPSAVEAYLASGEWKGKAGAYAVQGLAGFFVSRLQGEYSNVVGLPCCLLSRLFRELGFDLLQRLWYQAEPKSL